jgi:hypothetical protein
MIDPIPLFMVTVLPLVRVGLLRYQGLAGGWRCGPRHRHEATTWIEEPLEQAVGVHRRVFSPGPETVPLDDPRWPKRCENRVCMSTLGGADHIEPEDVLVEPYRFAPADPATVLHERLGRREDAGEHVLAYSPPIGGVVHLDYLEAKHRASDGRSLGVVTPDGLWYVDVKGRAGEVFIRKGDGAVLITEQTAGPAWRWRLRDGMLEEVPGAG